VLVTGYLGEEAAVSGLKKGASDIVYKDRLAVLPAAVWRAVQERALREAQARAEKALRAANQVLTALIRCAPLPITVIDRHGTVNVWNPAAEEVLGYGKEEALGNRLSELVGGDLAGLLERSLDEGGVIGAETRHRRPDGATVDVRVYSSPLRGAGEEIHGVVGMITDVTERNLIVEAFRESKERFQSAFLYAPIGMAIASLDGRILRVNPAFCRMLGTTEAELLRRSWQDLVHPRDRCVPGGEAEPGAGRRELRLVARDGRVVFAQWDTSLVCDSGGRPQYQIGQVVDITAAKEAEEKIRRYAADLERSNADLQHFAYVASHDLQEPLRMVRGFVELLARRYQGKLGPDADEYIRYAVDGARRMQDLIRGLLAYSRVGTQGKSFAPVAAEEPFRRALMNLQAAIEESGAEVSCDPLPAVLADDTQLAQLFQNLIGNAVKFRGEDPPRIAVRVADKKEVWEFAVEDNGIGFDPQHADRIFQMFQRLHGPTKYAGTGIGLALCKRIVERHGGGMRVESAPGKGSTFYFTLPKQPPQEVETGAASSAEVVGR
jgi:PAS domain S-box-containing protein